jgi:hypothetical protein
VEAVEVTLRVVELLPFETSVTPLLLGGRKDSTNPDAVGVEAAESDIVPANP